MSYFCERNLYSRENGEWARHQHLVFYTDNYSNNFVLDGFIHPRQNCWNGYRCKKLNVDVLPILHFLWNINSSHKNMTYQAVFVLL